MARRLAPTKQRAPVANPEASCPHRLVEEDEFQLEVDCSDCPGPCDLNTRRCASGIVNALMMCPRPECIILRKHTHRRYRGAAVARLYAAGLELAEITRAVNSALAPSDKRCRTCPASALRVMTRSRSYLLEDPHRYTASPRKVMADLKKASANVRCPKLAECYRKGVSVTSLSGLRE